MPQVTDIKHLADIKQKNESIIRLAAKVETMRTEHLEAKHRLETAHGKLSELINASDDEVAQLSLDFPNLDDHDDGQEAT